MGTVIPFMRKSDNSIIKDLNIFLDFYLSKSELKTFEEMLNYEANISTQQGETDIDYILTEMVESVAEIYKEIDLGRHTDDEFITICLHVLEFKFTLDAIISYQAHNKDVHLLEDLYTRNKRGIENHEKILNQIFNYNSIDRLNLIENSWEKYIIIEEDKNR